MKKKLTRKERTKKNQKKWNDEMAWKRVKTKWKKEKRETLEKNKKQKTKNKKPVLPCAKV